VNKKWKIIYKIIHSQGRRWEKAANGKARKIVITTVKYK
jgi:hypothetical protein